METKNKKNKSRTYRFISAQLAVMLILSIAVSQIVSKNARNTSLNYMQTISENQAGMIEDYIENSEKILEMYSTAPEIISVAENPDNPDAVMAAQKFTEDFSSKIDNLEGIYVSEWNTHVLAHTNPAVVGITTRTDERLVQLQNLLTDAGSGLYDAGIIISPASGQQIVSMYKGLFDENGNPVGLVGLGIYTSGLVSRLNNTETESIKNGEYFMVDINDEKYIFNSDSEKVAQDAGSETIKSLCSQFRECTQDCSGSFEYKSEETGKKYVSVYHYMADKGWILVFDDYKSEIYNLSITMNIYLIVFFLIIAILLVFIFAEIKRSEKRNELELRQKEKQYNEEMNSIVYALPEGSSMLTVNLNSGKILSRRGYIQESVSDEGMSDFVLYKQSLLSSVKNDEQKQYISSMLETENLLSCFNRNEKELSYSYSTVNADGGIEIKELSVHMLQNHANGDTEAAIQNNDVSDKYYKTISGLCLTANRFRYTAVIFTESGCMRMIENNSGIETGICDYSDFQKNICENTIDRNEKEIFFRNTSLSILKENLKKSPVYCIYTHSISDSGKKTYEKYEFQYTDESREIILLSVTDETSLWEKDNLTGLNNYKGFISQASYYLENSTDDTEYSVLVLNIKWFKVANKIFGSKICDNFLKEYASKLEKSELEPVITGRFPNSDHFIMLVRREKLDTDILCSLLRQRIETTDKEADIFINCGIYNISSKQTPVSTMIEHAIMAYKGVKDVYNTPYSVFSEKEEENYLSGRMVVSNFDKALSKKEFIPFYQPIYDAVTHRVVSAEALVRWKKDGTLIPPGMFIPALEENGSISKVDLCISESVTSFQKKRKSEGKKVVPVSVNLSVMDFYSAETIEGVMKHIEELSDADIISRYEITETAWADTSETRNEIIEKMKAKGAKILIDDFGSGYSSFSTVRDFNFDILKIDMGFIQKLGTSHKADGIVSSIIDMAHFIGLKVVAEGVENKDHLDFLTENGCDYIQGYYFSRPLPEEDFAKLLDEEQ